MKTPNQTPKSKSLPQPPPLPSPSGSSEEDDFKYFYGCAMIAHYGQFEVPKMETSDGLMVDAVTPSLEYYRNDDEEEADNNTREIWMERRSKHLSECCSMAAMHGIEQLHLYRTKAAF
jgi:hypothetical protein